MADAQPTSQTQITTTIPDYAQPYAQQLLGSVFGGVDPTTGKFMPGLIGQGYQPYGKQTVAGFSPLQQQAMESIAGMRITPQLAEASGLASLAGRRAGELGRYTPAPSTSFYSDPTFREGDVGFERVGAPSLERYQMAGPQQVGVDRVSAAQMGAAPQVMAPSLERYQMSGPERVGAERFGMQAMQDYMSPYMSGVVEQQKRAAVQDYARQIPGLQAAGIRAGARGGTREALLQAEAQRNLQNQLQGIEATGTQQAYQQAAQQFGADRAAAMQAALANQQAGMTAGQTNLQALLSQQQLGTQAGLQAALANQQAGLTTGQTNLQAQQQAALANQQAAQQAALANQQAGLTTGQTNLQALLGQQQLGANLGMQAGQLNQAAQLQAQQQRLAQLSQQNQFGLQNAAQRAQYGLAGAQLGESSRQFGANLGLQGLQQQLAAAGTLGGLGMQQYQQGMGITQAQLGAGAQGQALDQALLNQQYQDFVNQQQFPYKQAEFGMGILRGIPATGQVGTLYQQPPSMWNAIAGAGMMGVGSLFGSLGGGK